MLIIYTNTKKCNYAKFELYFFGRQKLKGGKCMKKLFFSVFSVALVFGSFFNGHVQVGATSNSEDLVEPAAVYSKTVTQLKVIPLTGTISQSIPYKANGWSGTLYLQSYQHAGDHYIARYSGTVSCSGVCPMTKDEE